MSKLAWLTPDSISGVAPFVVYIPDDDEMRAAFKGALLLLEFVYNWEAFGDATPQNCADAWSAANRRTFRLERALPVGMIAPFGGGTVPDGWLLCDGSQVLLVDYPDLFSVIGGAFGAVDENFFYLPDLSFKVPVGLDGSHNIGDTGGAATVTLQLSEVPSHSHTVNSHNHSETGSFTATAAPGAQPVLGFAGSHNTGNASPGTDAQGGDGSHENMPPYIVLNYIIRASLYG